MTQVHRLFFAVRPDAPARDAMIAAQQRVCAAQRLTGRPIAPERLHVTLHWLGDHAGLPMALVADAMRAGGQLDRPPFDVVFDRVGSLRTAGHGGPIVLTGGERLAELHSFQRALASEMTDAGIGNHVHPRFRPHVTLLYDDGHVAPQVIEPVRWTVNELLLLDSLVGQASHVVLGRWPLRS